MVNKKAATLVCEEFDGEESLTVQICAAMDDLRHHNQTLEDNIPHIHKHQKQTNTMDELEVLDPQPLSNETWEVSVL